MSQNRTKRNRMNHLKSSEIKTEPRRVKVKENEPKKKKVKWDQSNSINNKNNKNVKVSINKKQEESRGVSRTV